MSENVKKEVKAPSKAESIEYFNRIQAYLQKMFTQIERSDAAMSGECDPWACRIDDVPSKELLDAAGSCQLLIWRLTGWRDVFKDAAKGYE